MLSSAIALPLQYQNEIKVKMLNYLLNRDLENLAKASEARSRNIVWIHLSAIVARVENLAGQIEAETENTRSTKVLHAKLSEVISQENGPNIQYSILKNMISGEPVMVKLLYKDPSPTTDYGKIIASYNTLPRAEQALGNYRRWDILEYKVTISEEERDVYLKEKLCEELAGILNWVLECLAGLIERRAFITSECSRKSLQNYMHDSNNALRFFEEMCVVDQDGRVTAAELFNAYLQFCRDEGVTSRYGKIIFLKQLETVGVERQRTATARYLNVKFKSTF